MPPQLTESATPGMFDALGVEIFGVGVHNGDAFNERDLDEIVEAHNQVGKQLRPFLKLGHDPKQKLLQKDGYPAAGWIDNLQRKGGKLIADLKAIPRKVRDLIERGSYGRFSSEIYFNAPVDGKTYPRALKAVALLGGDTPAVKDLDDFTRLLEADTVAYAYVDEKTETRTYESEVKEFPADIDRCVQKLKAEGVEEGTAFAICNRMKKEGKGMFADSNIDTALAVYKAITKEAEMPEEDKEKDKKIGNLEAKIEALQGKLDASEKVNAELKEKYAEAKAQLKKHAEEDAPKLAEAEKKIVALQEEKVTTAKATQTEKDNAEVAAACDAAVKDGRMTPAMVGSFKALMVGEGERTVQYTEKGENKSEKHESPKAVVLAAIKALPKIAEFSDDSKKTDKPDPKPENEAATDPSEAEVKTFIEEQEKLGIKVTYADAVRGAARNKKGA